MLKKQFSSNIGSHMDFILIKKSVRKKNIFFINLEKNVCITFHFANNIYRKYITV